MIARVPLRDEVYRQVLDRIHRGDLPAGARLRDAELASQLGVSRTPVREALLRLAREGVLDSSMGRGFRVRSLDASELEEVGAILGALESLALRLSAEPPPDRLDRLAELDRRLEQTRGDAVVCLDIEDEWHRTLLEGCPNRRLLELIASLRQVPRRYLAAFMRDAGRLSLSTLPHTKIAHALRDGGRDSAAAVFEQQWRRGLAELGAWTAGRTPDPKS
ncbi:MAG TPA: GntR family transcriptional regulator [Gemmatimonadales bacterium]|nr:GntR family transcriptional regulator [Gemmatimonadales bacterium]